MLAFILLKGIAHWITSRQRRNEGCREHQVIVPPVGSFPPALPMQLVDVVVGAAIDDMLAFILLKGIAERITSRQRCIGVCRSGQVVVPPVGSFPTALPMQLVDVVV